MPTPGSEVSTRAHFLYLTYRQPVTGILGSYPLLVGSDVNQAGQNLRHKLSFPYARKCHSSAIRTDHIGCVFPILFAQDSHNGMTGSDS